MPKLLALVEPDERGDSGSPLRWTTKSSRTLATELTRQGHPDSPGTVGDLLREEGFRLQGSTKAIEGKQHSDRDAQFRYIAARAKSTSRRGASDQRRCQEAGKAGLYAQAGRVWGRAGELVRVCDHSFSDAEPGVVIPYGVYDLAANTGWVNLGTDHDTAAFPIGSIRRWWNGPGKYAYPAARRLLVTADVGGRSWLPGGQAARAAADGDRGGRQLKPRHRDEARMAVRLGGSHSVCCTPW